MALKCSVHGLLLRWTGFGRDGQPVGKWCWTGGRAVGGYALSDDVRLSLFVHLVALL